MKQVLLMIAVVALVGCGKKEPELRSEKIITPDEAANELFVEAIELVRKAKSEENSNIPAAIKSYEEALVKVRKIVNEYKKSDLAVKLVSGETLFTGKSMEQIYANLKRLRSKLWGTNPRLISKETEMAQFLDEGYSKQTFSEKLVQQVAEIKYFSNISPLLKWKVQWRGSPAMIYGLAPREVAPPGRKKPIMITPVKRGTVQLGKTLAAIHEVKRDQTVTVEGSQFEVARVLPEKGSGAEIRIYMHLADAQSVLMREGQINEIGGMFSDDTHATGEGLSRAAALLKEHCRNHLPELQVFLWSDVR
jgi:hypothetical protein